MKRDFQSCLMEFKRQTGLPATSSAPSAGWPLAPASVLETREEGHWGGGGGPQPRIAAPCAQSYEDVARGGYYNV